MRSQYSNTSQKYSIQPEIQQTQGKPEKLYLKNSTTIVLNSFWTKEMRNLIQEQMDCVFSYRRTKKINQRRCLSMERTTLQVRSKENQHNGFHRPSWASLAWKQEIIQEILTNITKAGCSEKKNKQKTNPKKVDLKIKQDCRHLKKNVITLSCPSNKQHNRTPLCQRTVIIYLKDFGKTCIFIPFIHNCFSSHTWEVKDKFRKQTRILKKWRKYIFSVLPSELLHHIFMSS